jgi:hypothetical protein
MALYSEFRPVLSEIARYLRFLIGGNNITSAGTGSIPAGFKSISIIKTSTNADSVTLTLLDGTVYTMTELGEGFSDSASAGSLLPPYTKGGAGTIKWHGIK